MTKKQAINLSNNIKKIAVEASLTGALADGYKILMTTYNNILKLAIEEKWIQEDIVSEITESMFDSNTNKMDIIGTSAALLLALLLEE
jgi:hypothetical protein